MTEPHAPSPSRETESAAQAAPSPMHDGTKASPIVARTVGQLVLGAAGRYGGIALQFRRGGETIAISYPKLGTIATEIARGLIALEIDQGDRVAILGTTSAEWTLADCGAACAGAIVTPIYQTNSPQECEYVLSHSETRLVFCEDAAQAAKIARVRNSCPRLEHVVLFDGAAEGAITLAELRERGADASGRDVELRACAADPDDVATLVYTSGTTGVPKGCMLTHANFLETTRMYAEELGVGERHTLYQFLPLAHVLARVAQGVVIRAGARAVFWSGDPKRIVDDLGELRPTHFPAVPRVYEKVHGAVNGRIEDGPALRRALFKWALGRGAEARARTRRGEEPGASQALQYRVADRLVLAKVRDIFGDRLQMGLVGAAPVARELLEFFDACGVLLLEAYGLTESCAAATLNTPRAVRFGSVGKPLPGTEVTIADDGEILIRGPHVFKGYYKDPQATAEAIGPGGWLHSGDLGGISEDGFVAIDGRKKDVIITSSGKNIAPVNIESELRESRYITEAVVFGDNRPYLVAVLTLDRDEVAKLAARLGIANDPITISQDPRVHEEIQKVVDSVNERFARIEQIKRFAILEQDFMQAAGELTPTLKVKRAFVYDKYADVFTTLYE